MFSMNQYQAIFYETEAGSMPAMEFLNGLDPKMRAKVASIVALLEHNGPSLWLPYSEHLDDGIFEIRAKVGSNISRVLYFFVVDKQIILTNGFVKKTQKTPVREIELAKKYRQDYLSRNRR